jgi:hypothetical protein
LLSQLDFLASFAHLAGVPLSQAEVSDSEQRADAILGRTQEGRDHLVTEGIGAKTLVREGDWVFIPSHPGPAFIPNKAVESGYAAEPQLYNLSTDIGQRRNVASTNPERVAALTARLESISSCR